jgi:hypothetical protein
MNNLDKFLGHITHPTTYPHSGIPYAERFPRLDAKDLGYLRSDFKEGLQGLQDVENVVFGLRLNFGVPLPGECQPGIGEGTEGGHLAHYNGGSHNDRRRAIDNVKDGIIASVAHDMETMRALGRSIDSRIAALEALAAMTREVEEVGHGCE